MEDRESQIDNRESRIAWAGWSLRAPAGWQPLKIEGGHHSGRMIVGAETMPAFAVQWKRVGKGESVNVEKWIDARLRKVGGTPAAGAPCPHGMTRSAWCRDVETRDGRTQTLWYGYSDRASLLLEVAMTSPTDESVRNRVISGILPSIRTEPASGGCGWRIYDVGFTSPPGYELRQRRLYSGDVAFHFAEGGTRNLVMRQLYPGTLAVDRRSPEQWLDAPPFLERRRLRRSDTAQWTGGSGRELAGIVRRGWKRLPSPMGWCAPRFSTAIAAVDGKLDRLLIADHTDVREDGNGTACWAIQHMT